MKAISGAAMDAIIAGEALVTGAVEILPAASYTSASIAWSADGVVNINAVSNASATLAGASSVGITRTGYDPSDILRFTMVPGGTYTAWNWVAGWVNEFDVMVNGDTGRSFRINQNGVTASNISHTTTLGSAAAARDAFGSHTVTGGSSYTFFIYDSPIVDNSGGVSVTVERGVTTGGTLVPAGDPIRLWGGYGPITLDGEVYQGIGDRGLAQQTGSAIGGVAQGMTIGLSGIEPAVLDLIDTAGVQGASVVTRRLIFASDGRTLLDHSVWDRGRCDTIDRDEVIGGSADLILAIESAARGLGRSGARQRADSDQRLIAPTDGYFKHTAYAGEKTLYWGGKKPAIGLHG